VPIATAIITINSVIDNVKVQSNISFSFYGLLLKDYISFPLNHCMVLLEIILATLLVCFLSLVGVASFWVKPKLLDKTVLLLVGFSAGALMGGAFLHLLPESVEVIGAESFGIVFLLSFSLFFLLERLVHWHHCHESKPCKVHAFAYLNLVGDALHNFMDGLIIAASFLASIPLGIATTIAVIAHELPQELGDFGVLVYAGFSKKKALAFNFVVSLTALAGALIGYYLSGAVAGLESYLLPFAAGSFVYIASSDLIPELHKQEDLGKAMQAFALFLTGLAFMYAVKLAFA